MSWSIRNYRSTDLPMVAALLAASDAVDRAGFGKTLESLAQQLASDTLDPERNAFVAVEGGQIVGFVRLRLALLRGERHDSIFTMGTVHPSRRRRGIGMVLMRWVEQRAQELKEDRPLYLYLSVREPVRGMEELAQDLAMDAERFFFWLECDHLDRVPAPVFPPGIRVRSYVMGQDEQAFVTAQNEAFSDHWGFVETTMEIEYQRQQIRDFRPQDTLLAVDDDGNVAGFALVHLPQGVGHLPEGSTPVIEILGVRPAFQRRGIGRALLLTAMRHVREAGLTVVGLSVDTDNPHKARRLYESVGFEARTRNTAYRKRI